MGSVDKIKIREFLDTFIYPLYFLDYETYPKDFVSDKEQIPFQYSLHIQKEFDGEIDHKFYLHKNSDFPEKSLVPHLINNLGETGTILVWSKSFETGCNKLISKLYPKYATEMLNINNRIIDLADPFRLNWLLEDELGKRWSLKKVFPLFCDDNSYNDLQINDGRAAQESWIQAVENNFESEHIIFQNLEKYCYLDTYSMVLIHNKLKSIVYQNQLF